MYLNFSLELAKTNNENFNVGNFIYILWLAFVIVNNNADTITNRNIVLFVIFVICVAVVRSIIILLLFLCS